EAEGGVMVLGVGPREEDVAVGAGVLDRAEACRECWAVLQRLELRLRERVVVGDVRPGVSLRHTEVGEEKSNGLGSHCRTPVGVDGELPGVDALPGTGLSNESQHHAHAVDLRRLLRLGSGRCGEQSAGQSTEEHTPIHHWITSSARASSDGGIVRPRALAVLRLITNSNCVACSTGRSPGLVPLRILSAYTAARLDSA